jgi:16S rRNA (guanine527-N7)-methyltransferase
MLTAAEIGRLLEPYVNSVGSDVCSQLSIYLELILKWNAKTNLTAIREPEEIVRRHFGESLFAGSHLGECGTLLDFGSGAGFPGVPIQLLRPDVQVTLAESQGKKASFLREVIRTLGLRTEVWAARVEEMPVGRQFDVVAMRAVDKMEAAVAEAAKRARERVLILGTSGAEYSEFGRVETVGLPGSADGVLWIGRRA